MPARSKSDLKTDRQGFEKEKSQFHHRLLARFMVKREMAKVRCFESSVNKGEPSVNKGEPSVNKGAAALILKTPSPTRQDSSANQPKNKAALNPIPRSRVQGGRPMPGEKAAPEAPSVPRREHPKSPLAYLLKKNQVKGNQVNRLLIIVNVLGSAGPLRFLVSSDDPVQKVIEIALKSYAREGRLPVLGQNIKQFELYCANSGCGEALNPSEIVGSLGIRNFLLCKKRQSKLQEEEKQTNTSHPHQQKGNLWKNLLLTMSTSFGLSSR